LHLRMPRISALVKHHHRHQMHHNHRSGPPFCAMCDLKLQQKIEDLLRQLVT
jgi:hypothetical protein